MFASASATDFHFPNSNLIPLEHQIRLRLKSAQMVADQKIRPARPVCGTSVESPEFEPPRLSQAFQAPAN